MTMTTATHAQLAAATFTCATPSGALANIVGEGIPRTAQFGSFSERQKWNFSQSISPEWKTATVSFQLARRVAGFEHPMFTSVDEAAYCYKAAY